MVITIVLAVGVFLYFFVRLFLWIKYRAFSIKESKDLTRKIIFFTVDFCIITAVIFQLIAPNFWKIDIGSSSNAVRMFGLSIFVIGIIIATWGRLLLGQNWQPAICYEIGVEQKLVTTGLFSKMRHPIYSGMILMGFGFELVLNSWLILAIVPLVFILYQQAKLEEKLLGNYYPSYQEYKARSWMFVPKIF